MSETCVRQLIVWYNNLSLCKCIPLLLSGVHRFDHVRQSKISWYITFYYLLGYFVFLYLKQLHASFGCRKNYAFPVRFASYTVKRISIVWALSIENSASGMLHLQAGCVVLRVQAMSEVQARGRQVFVLCFVAPFCAEHISLTMLYLQG